MTNLVKEFNGLYFNTVLAAFQAVKTSGLIGGVETASIENEINVTVRSNNNLETFKEKNNLSIKGSSFPLMEFEETVKPAAIAVNFIMWSTEKYGKLLTTPANKEEILKLEIGRILRGFLEEYAFNVKFNQTLLFEIVFEEMLSWIRASEYNDAPGSVYPIFGYVDRSGDTHTIYMNGSYAINNIEEEEKLSDEQIARHLLGEIRREYFRRIK